MFHIWNNNHCWVSNIKPVLKKCVMKIVFSSFQDYNVASRIFFSSNGAALGLRQSLNIFPLLGFLTQIWTSENNDLSWETFGSLSKGLLFLLCLKYLQRKISDIHSKSDNISGLWHNSWRKSAWSLREEKRRSRFWMVFGLVQKP